MEFHYELTDYEQIPPEVLLGAVEALEKRAYVCQQEFERLLDMYHQINLFDTPRTVGEAVVTSIAIEGGEVFVTLSLKDIKYS